MHIRAVRLILFALLVGVGLGSAYVIWDTQRQVDEVLATERDVDARIDQLAARVAALGAAQQAAVVPGQSRSEWLSRESELFQQIHEELAALRPRAMSTQAGRAFASFGDALNAMVTTDARIRVHLQMGQQLMAADLVFSEGRESIGSMAAVLRDLEVAEHAAAIERQRAMHARAAAILGGAALVWLLGLLALVRVPNRVAVEPVATRHSTTAFEPAAPVVASTLVNAKDAAEICTALSRLTSASALPDLLARAAQVLDASGIIVWLGAGEELFAVTAHGYDSRVLARLGPIARTADNATAAAWRSGAMQIVAGDMMGNGAIVAPLFGSAGCIGVLAAELRHGRESDETTQAVTAMIAAQLAAVVAAWPPASAGPQQGTSETPAATSAGGATAATA
jgi:hypothetical protein